MLKCQKDISVISWWIKIYTEIVKFIACHMKEDTITANTIIHRNSNKESHDIHLSVLLKS